MRKGFALDDDRLKNLVPKTQIFHQNIIDAPETSWYFIFNEKWELFKGKLAEKQGHWQDVCQVSFLYAKICKRTCRSMFWSVVEKAFSQSARRILQKAFFKHA